MAVSLTVVFTKCWGTEGHSRSFYGGWAGSSTPKACFKDVQILQSQEEPCEGGPCTQKVEPGTRFNALLEPGA